MPKSTKPDRSRRNAADPAGPRARVPWGTVSREQVVNAAIRAIEHGGYEEMTIRSLAASLGVAPMTLYRHVTSKDDLLDEVADRLLAESWQPRARTEDWQAWTAEAARLLRNLLVSQPAVLHVYLRHPIVTPAAIARMEAMLAVLHQAGFDERCALRGYASVHTYTVGFAALEASRTRWVADTAQSGHVTRQLAEFTTSRQFAVGLGYLLSGMERDRTAEHA